VHHAFGIQVAHNELALPWTAELLDIGDISRFMACVGAIAARVKPARSPQTFIEGDKLRRADRVLTR
jgi:hypothetical protein